MAAEAVIADTQESRPAKVRYHHRQVAAIDGRNGWLTLSEFDGVFGWAWTSPDDQFCRAKGRMIADGRRECLGRPIVGCGDPWWANAILSLLPVSSRIPETVHRAPRWLHRTIVRDFARSAIDREAGQ